MNQIIQIKAQQKTNGCSVYVLFKGGLTERWPCTPKQFKLLERVLRKSGRWNINPCIYDNLGFNARLIITTPAWQWFSLTTPNKAQIVAALDLASVQ